jgi:hypothetical protein
MHVIVLLLAATLADGSPASPGKADDSITVKLSTITSDGVQDAVMGTCSLKAITVKGRHGTMEVPAGKLSSLSTTGRSNEEGPVLSVHTVDDHLYEGMIVAPKRLEIAGKYGRFTTDWNDVHELKVVAARVDADEADEDEKDPGTRDVWIETEAGNKIGGPLYSVTQGRITSVAIDCDLGDLSLDADKIRSIEFDPASSTFHEDDGATKKNGTILTKDGTKLSGEITVGPGWVVRTKLGLLGLNAARLKSIKFEGPADEPEDPKTASSDRVRTSPPSADNHPTRMTPFRAHGGLGP